ncbi:DUF3461 family protein [Plesiomonas shigelloides]|uniref:DUF3461 family protein n=1 Tax=Plesiomonas shigelloides TaxID=703 RepID=UPI0030BE1C75
MYENLKKLGITHPHEIDRYSLRQEADFDILKIYFQKEKGEFFAKSVKFKYPRPHKTLPVDGQPAHYLAVSEINPSLRFLLDELEHVTGNSSTSLTSAGRTLSEAELKQKILGDLRHLEKVVANKIAEIEADLEKLTAQR